MPCYFYAWNEQWNYFIPQFIIIIGTYELYRKDSISDKISENKEKHLPPYSDRNYPETNFIKGTIWNTTPEGMNPSKSSGFLELHCNTAWYYGLISATFNGGKQYPSSTPYITIHPTQDRRELKFYDSAAYVFYFRRLSKKHCHISLLCLKIPLAIYSFRFIMPRNPG